MREHRIAVGEYLFDVTEWGPEDGRAVVLLHGFPQVSASYTAVAELLAAEGLRAIAVDQRGYSPGARPDDVADYAMPHLVGDVVGLLDALGLDRADLVGHDWGAMVAWSTAALAPERIRTLTAVSVPHPRAFAELLAEGGAAGDEQREKSAYISLFRMPGKAEEVLLDGDTLRRVYDPLSDEMAAPYVAAMSESARLTAALNWYRAMDLTASSDLPTVTVPTTFVWSNADIAIGRGVAERCTAYVGGEYRFVELDGISHWIPDQAPETLAREIIERVGSAAD